MDAVRLKGRRAGRVDKESTVQLYRLSEKGWGEWKKGKEAKEKGWRQNDRQGQRGKVQDDGGAETYNDRGFCG